MLQPSKDECRYPHSRQDRTVVVCIERLTFIVKLRSTVCTVIKVTHAMLAHPFYPPHRITAAPQLSPAPNPEMAMMSPFLTFPACTASVRASGIDPMGTWV